MYIKNIDFNDRIILSTMPVTNSQYGAFYVCVFLSLITNIEVLCLICLLFLEIYCFSPIFNFFSILIYIFIVLIVLIV